MISTLKVSPIFSNSLMASSRLIDSRRNGVSLLMMAAIAFSIFLRSSSVKAPSGREKS